MGSYLNLYTSLRASRYKCLATCFPALIRRYSQVEKENECLFNNQGPAETVEKLQKEIEEEEKFGEAKAWQEVARQTIEKVEDGFKEASVGEADVDSVKKKLVELEAVGIAKAGDEDDKGVLER